MAYDGIIFDFNGTLFFDSDKQEQAWHTVSRQLRGKGFTSEEMYERVHGRSSRSIFEYLLRKPLTQEQVWELIERKETIYRELCLQDEERFRLAPGAAELLDWLCEHDIPHTIATASEIRNVRFFREHFGLDRWSIRGESSTTTARFQASRRRISTSGPPNGSGCPLPGASWPRTPVRVSKRHGEPAPA